MYLLDYTDFCKIALSSEEAAFQPERLRPVERGSQIVTAIPSSSSIVLQMQRGNLETIFPRPLVLLQIRTALSSKEYRTAFLICRQHRVDLNILHEYDPIAFSQDISHFVSQIKQPDLIDVFITSIRNPTQIQHPHSPTAAKYSLEVNRVNDICDILICYFAESKKRSLLQCSLTAYLSKHPPDYISALSLIKPLLINADIRLEQAINHACFLSDVNDLYDEAMGMYDLPMALLFARHSQKDPREYKQLLTALEALPRLRQRFEIDTLLKRHNTALKYLIAAPESSKVEICDYISRHSLYYAALMSIDPNHMAYVDIVEDYGRFLKEQNNFSAAGHAFERARKHDKAIECYKIAGRWAEALTLAFETRKSDHFIKNLSSDLALQLTHDGKLKEAALIYSEYLHDEESALDALCKAFLFVDARRLLASRPHLSRLPKLLLQGIEDAQNRMLSNLSEMHAQLTAQRKRLQEIRSKSKEHQEKDENTASIDVPDDISLAITNESASIFTRYTNVSQTSKVSSRAKQKRKEERKRALGKRGSIYEKEYLLNSLNRLITKSTHILEDLQSLLRISNFMHLDENALQCRESYLSLCDELQKSILEDFIPGGHDQCDDIRPHELIPNMDSLHL